MSKNTALATLDVATSGAFYHRAGENVSSSLPQSNALMTNAELNPRVDAIEGNFRELARVHAGTKRLLRVFHTNRPKPQREMDRPSGNVRRKRERGQPDRMRITFRRVSEKRPTCRQIEIARPFCSKAGSWETSLRGEHQTRGPDKGVRSQARGGAEIRGWRSNHGLRSILATAILSPNNPVTNLFLSAISSLASQLNSLGPSRRKTVMWLS
jgi:hypothetical protein